MPANFETVLLGIIQGVTEILPVSRSGHFTLAQHLFGFAKPTLLLDVFLRAATLLSTIVVLRKRIIELARAIPRLPRFFGILFQKGHLAIGDDPTCWVICLIFISTVLTGAIGILIRESVENIFANLYVVGAASGATGILLLLTRRVRHEQDKSPQKSKMKDGKTISQATLKDAAVIGLAQGLSILPGLSRSGATLSASLLRGFHREFAGEYAFLISVPAVAGVLVLQSTKGIQSPPSWGPIVTAFLTAFILGAVSLHYLLDWIRNGKLHYFAYYCFLASALAFFIQLRP